ncbi:MAG: DHHA1 domain-containing protein [Acidobacteriota bacterium]|nr:DHHA1 domain-containing protein [Acidobacteriota bacterium]
MPQPNLPTISDLTRERLEILAQHVQKTSKGRWLVLTHDNPDPDSLAAASLLGRLLHGRFKQQVTLGYGGIVGRAENREMVRSLGMKLSHIRHLNFKQYKHFALVDTQPRTGNNSLPEDIVPDLVVDHHPQRRATGQVPVADIRVDYGATATIVAEYLLASDLQPTHKGATALVYAIRSETQDFSRESAGPDKAMYDYVLGIANKRLLGKIQNAPLPPSYFGNLHQALENLRSVDTLVISHLGKVQQPDIVPEVADFLLRMEDKTWSLCSGIYEDRMYLSIRTTNPRANAGEIMKKLVRRRGKGGGHSMIAGGWVQLNQDATAQQKTLAERLAKALRKKPEKIAPIQLPNGD